MILKLSDDIVERYQQAALTSSLPVEHLIERTLARYADYPASMRTLVLSSQILQQVDRLLGPGSTLDPDRFLAALQSYASISIGDVRLDFTQAQKAEIAHRAVRQGKSPREVTEDVVRQMEEMFLHGPRATV